MPNRARSWLAGGCRSGLGAPSAIAVMLDFVNPVRAGRRSVSWGWEAGFDKTGGHLGQYIGLGRPAPFPFRRISGGLPHVGLGPPDEFCQSHATA